MAKKPTTPVSTYKCARCGNPLPVDERGMPVTSLWRDGKYFCPDCKFKKPETNK